MESVMQLVNGPFRGHLVATDLSNDPIINIFHITEGVRMIARYGPAYSRCGVLYAEFIEDTIANVDFDILIKEVGLVTSK